MLERAFLNIVKEPVMVTGSGRTDSGVHAIAQVGSCTLTHWRSSAESLGAALNTQLPPDIVITHCVDAPDAFHAIRDCIGKRYRYQLQSGGVRGVFDFRYRWHIKFPINVERMQEAASVLLGEHDFACFQAAGSDRKTTVRNVRDCVVVREPVQPNDGVLVAIEIEANGFLYNMVRNIVGTLIDVGRGKQDVAWVQHVLASGDRTLAGPTAPPHGLFLLQADYAPFA